MRNPGFENISNVAFIKVQDSTGFHFHDDKDVNKPECRRHYDKEVTSDDRFRMIPNERHPALGRVAGPLRMLRQIAPHRAERNLNPDL